MTGVAVLGAGAFGTALAVVLAREGMDVLLWARDAGQVAMMQTGGTNRRLPGVTLPKTVSVTAKIDDSAGFPIVLLALPMQQLSAFLRQYGAILDGKALVVCAKGIDLATGSGPTELIALACPVAVPAILTGPSFAADIARGLPTALTLACRNEDMGRKLQTALSTATLRLYRSEDVTGAELGGALKNVVAIASGIVIGAGLGESARAALMTRGYAEMSRLALGLGARAETLAGLSGFGDLVLTCSSEQSRNFCFGKALGAGLPFDPLTTVEGAATARAVAILAARRGIEMPITTMVAAVLDGKVTISRAIEALLARPLKQE